MFFSRTSFQKVIKKQEKVLRFFYSCCVSNDLLCVFMETAIRIYFSHFSKESLKENDVKDRYMKEMLAFLYDLVFDLYKHLSSNLKLEMFENLFHSLNPVFDYNVSSFKVINKNYIDYLV